MKTKQILSILIAMMMLFTATSFAAATSINIFDANTDGKTNTADAVFILKFAAEMSDLDIRTQTIIDSNHDGAVNTADAVLVLKVCAGMQVPDSRWIIGVEWRKNFNSSFDMPMDAPGRIQHSSAPDTPAWKSLGDVEYDTSDALFPCKVKLILWDEDGNMYRFDEAENETYQKLFADYVDKYTKTLGTTCTLDKENGCFYALLSENDIYGSENGFAAFNKELNTACCYIEWVSYGEKPAPTQVVSVDPDYQLSFRSLDEYREFCAAGNLSYEDFAKYIRSHDYDMNGVRSKEDLARICAEINAAPLPTADGLVFKHMIFHPAWHECTVMYDGSNNEGYSFSIYTDSDTKLNEHLEGIKNKDTISEVDINSDCISEAYYVNQNEYDMETYYFVTEYYFILYRAYKCTPEKAKTVLESVSVTSFVEK